MTWLGVELDEVSAKEKLVSAVGGMIAIGVVALITRRALGLDGSAMLIASMGASAVLLFAVPHGQLSQPWPVLGGHVVSAVLGVTAWQLIGRFELAAAVAVGSAIGVMHVLKCIHPPGGATALTAVIGGANVHALGYGFVLRPVLLNAALMVVIAVAFNAMFPWRRYPAAATGRPRRTGAGPAPSHAQVLAALRSIDSFVDVNEDDLVRLVQLLAAPAEPIEPGRRAEHR
ncbi:MAG: HPP family protein [Actinobacteria bacterium]|nr:HPP family protein [Actinomycetota bacterium]